MKLSFSSAVISALWIGGDDMFANANPSDPLILDGVRYENLADFEANSDVSEALKARVCDKVESRRKLSDTDISLSDTVNEIIANRKTGGADARTVSHGRRGLHDLSFTRTGPVPIKDRSTSRLTILVSQPCIIEDLDVTVDISHTWVGDLTLVLVPPFGPPVSVGLVERPGLNTALGCCGSSTNFPAAMVTFDDSASANPDSGLGAGSSGPFFSVGGFSGDSPAPAGLSTLTDMNGNEAYGLWDFLVYDGAGADQGNIHSVRLDFNCALPDADSDGVPDGDDNCPYIFNPGQEDGDLDGFGDVCDNCPTIANPGQNLDACVGDCGSDPCITIITDDFESGFDPSTSLLWDSAEGASASANCGFVSPSNALYFSGSLIREVISEDISGASSLSFSLIIGTGSFPCENADDFSGNPGIDSEDVFLEFLIGGFWTPFAVFDTEDYPDFSCVEVEIPAGATKFKLSQPSFSGGSFDHWAIDDVKIHSCECCHPLLTAQITDDSGLYYAANGCEGFVACYPPSAQLLNLGFQGCVANLLWDGANGSDGSTATCDYPANVNCGEYCIIGDWTPPMPPMGCCSDADGNFPIGDCSQFVMCYGGVQSTPFDCPANTLYDSTLAYCNDHNEVDCPSQVTCNPMNGLDRRLGLGGEEPDKQLRGAGL